MIGDDSSGKSRSAAAWIVTGITFAVFLPAVFNDFVDWDDLPMIVQNPRFNPPTWGGVGWYWTHAAWNLYMPLTCTLWAGLAKVGWVATADQFGGHLNPQIFHFVSVLLHIVAATALFEILQIAVGDARAAAAGAILFAVHPIAVETVAFAGAMNNSLFGALSLLAIWQYLRWSGAAAGTKRSAFWLGTIALIMAMLAKPTAVIVPAIVMVLDRTVNRRNWRAVVLGALPWALMCVPCVVWTGLLQHGGIGQRTPIWRRPMIAGDAAAFYLGKLLLPIRMGIDYGQTPESVRSMTWIMAVVMCTIAWLLRKSRPMVAAAIVIFLAALLPNSGLLPFDFQKISTVADRYAYLAMIGPALVFAGIMARRRSAIKAVIAVVILALLICRTEMQIGVWRNGVELFRNAVAVNPDSWMSWSNLGNALAPSEPQEAVAACRRAAQINPEDANNWNTLGSILMSQGERAAAVDAFGRAWKLAPENPMIVGNYRRAASGGFAATRRAE